MTPVFHLNPLFSEPAESLDQITDNPGSPFIDVEAVSDDNEEVDERGKSPRPETLKRRGGGEEQQAKEEQKMLSLAEQFLAAMPDRIKYESSPGREDEEEEGSVILPDLDPADCWSQSEDLGVESMADDQSVDFEFNFEEACQGGGYRDAYTPTSSLSPASFSLGSPCSSHQTSPSPSLLQGWNWDQTSPPSTAEIREFLAAERGLSKLTLSEREQRELYLAAQIIQKAYRSYKGRKKSSESSERREEGEAGGEEGREAKAAVVIQNYYRRYKQVSQAGAKVGAGSEVGANSIVG